MCLLRQEEVGLKAEPGLIALPSSGFTSHQAVARTAGSVLLRLSDSPSCLLTVMTTARPPQLPAGCRKPQGPTGAAHNISLGTETLVLVAWGAWYLRG